MAITVVAHAGAGSPDTNTITVTATTTGADLLVVGIADYAQATIGTLTDAVGGNSNTWTALTTYAGVDSRVRLYYCKPTYIGSSHVFTYTITGGFPTICVLALAGTHATTPFDSGQDNGHAQASGFTVASGAITPSENGEIVVSMFMSNDTNAGVSVDSSLTVSDFANRLGGGHFEGAMAYIIQTTAGSVSATWDVPDGSYAAAAIASFRVAAAGGPPAGLPFVMQLDAQMVRPR